MPIAIVAVVELVVGLALYFRAPATSPKVTTVGGWMTLIGLIAVTWSLMGVAIHLP